MSLKQETNEIFTRYGLNDQEVKILLAFLGNPQATISMIAGLLEIDYETVKNTAVKLVKEGFIAEVSGIIPRFIPLEPYFTLFLKESSVFREQIEKIKDAVLEDQSKRFKSLEDTKGNAISGIDTAVKSQVEKFFRQSDEHDANKQNVIETARDRFTKETKALENTLHKRIEDDFSELDKDIKQMDTYSAKVWDDHSTKFTKDNTDLNNTLDQISDAQVSQTKTLEKNLHSIIDALNSNLKSIANGFISKYEGGITNAKSEINKIIADLLKDFTERVNNLENEIKKDLDNHVTKHKDNATALKPTLEEILAKYMDRMHKVVEDLKRQITKLLLEHTDHLNDTTKKMEKSLKERVDVRQDELVGQVKSFEDNTVVLIDNLADISSKLTDLGEILAKRGSAFKALFLGKHKRWVALREEIHERVTKLSGSMKSDFTASTATYIENTEKTKNSFKSEIEKILIDENGLLKQKSEELDKKAQNTVNAELEGLAADLSTEIDNTMKKNIEHCKDTTIKLKDSVSSSFKTHKENYNTAITRHNKNSIDHYDNCDRDVKNKVDGWYSEMDGKHKKAKTDISTETEGQIAAINKHRTSTKDKNVEHSKTFENDKETTKKKQKDIYTARTAKIRTDFDTSKKDISEKINKEIELFTKECKETNDKLHAMLEDHKSKYQETATILQQSLTKTVTDNTKETRDAIADFTLQYMNSIDEGIEAANVNETKLTDISTASAKTADVTKTKTWHIVGLPAIIEFVAESLKRVKSSIVIVTHEVVPKILEALSVTAYEKKHAKFLYTTAWSPEYDPIINKMKSLGNIQFRQLKSRGEYIGITREAEEVLLAPIQKDEANIVAIVSTEDGYCKLFSPIVGSTFIANSRVI